jgi:rhamnosyltransferase
VRVLVHLHTWNDADVIGIALDAVLQQTRPVDGILLVDNGSTDGTSKLAYPDIVTVVRAPLNLGTSGAVAIGIEYALAHGYDWIWVLDADSVPRSDALELLTRLAESKGGQVGVVSASHDLLHFNTVLRGRMLTPGGPRMTKLPKDRNFLACNSTIWSGALFNLVAVKQVGLPRYGTLGCWEDLSLDFGDTEFTYRIHRAGYKILVHCDVIIDHRIGDSVQRRILGWNFHSTNHSPFRRYIYFRNLVFFWVRIFHRRNWPMLLIWFFYRLSIILAGIVILERGRGRKIKACFVGIRDGLRGRLDGTFDAQSDKPLSPGSTV